MNIEAFSYSVLTAVIGMSVVFASLSALSALMYALRVIFEEQEAIPASDAGGLSGTGAGALSGTGAGANARSGIENAGGASGKINSHAKTPPLPAEVILAAAAHHLQHEERNRESSAAAWSGRERKQ